MRPRCVDSGRSRLRSLIDGRALPLYDRGSAEPRAGGFRGASRGWHLMSKPNLASEPSMEEILSSIRKMISDDRPGPSPMPDQLSRMHFGEPNRSSSPASANPAQQGGGHSSNFNSLADALKVATALSDQRRSIQQEIASVLDKRSAPQRAAERGVCARLPSSGLAGCGPGGGQQRSAPAQFSRLAQ